MRQIDMTPLYRATVGFEIASPILCKDRGDDQMTLPPKPAIRLSNIEKNRRRQLPHFHRGGGLLLRLF